MKRIAISTGLLLLALGANAALYLRPPAAAPVVEGDASVELGPHRLVVARALLREPHQMRGGRLDRLDIVLGSADLAPLPALDARNPEKAVPERVALVLTPSDDRLSSIDMFGKVYARFVTSEPTPGPAGLMLRRFREKSPYEDRELYLGVGTGRTFVALCPLPQAQDSEPCTTTFRLNGLDMELRFPAAMLGEWRRMSERAFSLLEESVQTEATQNRVMLPPA